MRNIWYSALLLCLGFGSATANPMNRTALACADSLWLVGDHAAALKLLTSVSRQARAAGDTVAEITALTKLGAREIASGHLSQAAVRLHRATTMAATRRDTSALLPAVRWWSLSSGLRGRTTEADSLYQVLYDTASAHRDRRYQGWACVGFASRELDRGDPAQAGVWYRKAVQLMQTAGDTGGELWARNGLGITLNRQRRFGAALHVYQDAANRARLAGASMAEASAVSNIGYQQMLFGDPGAAQFSFRRAADLFGALGMVGSRLTPAMNLALCEIELGNFDTAEAILDTSLALSRTLGLAESTGHLFTEKGRLEVLRGRDYAAQRHFSAVLAMEDTIPAQDRGRAIANLATVMARTESPAAALELLDKCRARLPETGMGTVRWELSQSRARILLALGQPAAAFAAVDAIDLEITGAGSDRHFIANKVLLAKALHAVGRNTDAITQLRSAARTWETHREKPGEYRWREARATSGREIFLQMARLLALEPGHDIAEIYRVLQNYKARTLLERTVGPAYADSLVQRTSATTGWLEFRRSLRPGDAVLDWYVGPDFSLLLAVTATSHQLVTLPNETELARRGELYLELLSQTDDPDNPTWLVASRGMARAILGSAQQMVRTANHLTGCPDGPLNRLPLAIVCGSGRAATWQVTPSLAFMAATRRGAPNTHKVVLLLAGTVGKNGEPLPGPASEWADLSRNYTNTEGVLVAPGSNPLPLEILASRQVLHLASHVVTDPRLPWRSAVDLMFVRPDGSVGRLAAQHIFGLHLDNRLTLLNGCNTGAGRALAGASVHSLATAFLAAGSRCVVATRWPVDDTTARGFSTRFYRHLARGESISEAVATSCAELRRTPATAAPGQWGAYVVFGDGTQKIDLERRR